MSVLILSEHNTKHVNKNIHALIYAASKINDDVHVLVIGGNVNQVSKEVSQIPGVKQVIEATAEHLDAPSPENVAQVLADVAKQYSHVVAPSTLASKAVMPRAAALLDVAPISDVIKIIDKNTFMRPIHAGSILATFKTEEPLVFMTIQIGSFDHHIDGTQAEAPIKKVHASEDKELSLVESRIMLDTSVPQLGTARVIVSGGRGFQTVEEFQNLLMPLAKELNAAIGATREMIRIGVPSDCQIGQSGQTVSPELYFAIGISGAPQHVCGMKGSKVVVAINRDENAPICEWADYVLIGNLFRQVPRLTEALKNLPPKK